MIKTIGIIGHTGMVGGSVYRYFKNKKFKVYGHSLDEEDQTAFECDVVFICVPTPFDWKNNKYDGSLVEKTLSKVKGKIAVIKSTIMIGTTDKLQKKFPKISIVFNPEFLSEATCDDDFRNPDRQIVGFTPKSKNVSKTILSILPKSKYNVTIPAKEAELVKYINNLHGIISVLEANHYYDVCVKEKLDYKRVMSSAEASKYMVKYYHEIFHKGYRGVGGKCFPKDLNAWLEYCKKNGLDSSIFESAYRYNKKLLKDQNLTEAKAEKL